MQRLPNEERVRRFNEWENDPTRGPWDDYTGDLPDPQAEPPSPPMNVPAGSEDAIMGDEIKTGDELIDFQGESGKKRFYLASTFYSMAYPRKNPFTRQLIKEEDISKHSANLTSDAGRRRKTKRRARKNKTKKRKSGKRIVRK